MFVSFNLRKLERFMGEGGTCSLIEGIVFRAAHDSSKAMRIWMGEMKKN